MTASPEWDSGSPNLAAQEKSMIDDHGEVRDSSDNLERKANRMLGQILMVALGNIATQHQVEHILHREESHHRSRLC
jgi:hypothetical protein